MTTVEGSNNSGIGKYLVVYICLLVLAGLQFVIAYSQLDGSQKLERMLFVALVEAGLALFFFMHLWGEKRGFVLFVVVVTIFVLLSMQFGWPDSKRMLVGVPHAQIQ